MNNMRRKMSDSQFEEFLANALKRADRAQADKAADEAAAARIMARLAGPLPRQKMPFWRLPAVLLDWQFALAWPRVAALAGCAVLGFATGLAGIDRRYDQPPASYSLANITDPGSSMFEPGPLTGGRP
jgi:hypothetical protein